MKCARIDCGAEATSAVGIALYPPMAVQLFHKTDRWLTRLVLGLDLCEHHASAMVPGDLMDSDRLAGIAKLVERSSGTAVDLALTKVVPVAYSDPDYQRLIKQRGAAC